MTTDSEVLKAGRYSVYNYKNGRKTKPQMRFVIGKFNGRYLCAANSFKCSHGHPFDTEWFNFKEEE